MLDIRYIRDNAEHVREAAAQKGYPVDVAALVDLDDKRRELLGKAEAVRRERNGLASQVSGKPSAEQLEHGKALKAELSTLEDGLAVTEEKFVTVLKTVPNMPLPDVPIGESEDGNVVASEWGEKPQFDFEPKNHWQIAEQHGWIDKERAAKVAGARFAYLKGGLVRLHMAMVQWALDQLMDEKIITKLVADNHLKISAKPFIPVLPPLMIRTEVYDAMDRLEPREDRYKIEGEELWLQGSAEHVLGSMHMNEIFDEKDLPLRYVGYATSFRREAGSYGKDMEGIFRLHQFDKLEMESLATAETALDEHLLLIALQEYLMRELKIPYRMINKCTYDIGKPNARGWDLEAWLPGQGKYRETHTADYMTDYQARRLQTRVRRNDGAVELVHTNDATALAQRPLIAIIENYQTADGNVRIPEVLRPYLGGRKLL
ncbi:MAG TPA: serine--tRNA ligase [Candidatus Acidoferrum sp.]|nr:serine--tRNA ligase [Candidatus Acidoferrum sp.]